MGDQGDIFNYEPRFNPTTGDFNYDVNQDAEHVVGPVNATEAPSFTPAPINSEDIAAQGRGEWNEGQPSKTNGNEVRGEINPYRIQSDTPYKILGVTKTKNGTIVHVDEYPTQKISPEEKERRSKEFGQLAGYGLAIPFGIAGTAQGIALDPSLSGGLMGAAGGIMTGYGTGKEVGTAAGKSYYDTDPSVPVTRQGNVIYVRVK